MVFLSNTHFLISFHYISLIHNELVWKSFYVIVMSILKKFINNYQVKYYFKDFLGNLTFPHYL